MPGDECRTCGGPLAARAGRRGRTSVYCSAACRQRAYRERRAPAAEELVPDLIADIQQQARELAPRLSVVFYSEVTALSSSVGRLHRVARIARDAAQSDVSPGTAAESPASGSGSASGPGSGEAAAVRSGDERAFAGMVAGFPGDGRSGRRRPTPPSRSRRSCGATWPPRQPPTSPRWRRC